MAKKATWETPQSLFDELDVEFGFQSDLAADETNAKCDRFYTLEDNTLKQPCK